MKKGILGGHINIPKLKTHARYKKNNTSGYRGVTFESGKWRARIRANNIDISIGTYSTKEEAAIAYDTYVLENSLEHNLNGVLDE